MQKIFNAEDALVRAQLISGTHALAVTLLEFYVQEIQC